MKKTLLIIAFLGAANLFAQEQINTELIETIKNLQTQLNQQQNDIQKLYSELNKEYRTYRIVKKDLKQTIIDNQVKVVDSLNTLINKSKQELSSINKQLNTKIQQTDENANSKISELDSNLDKNRLYWIIATLAILLLGGLVYWLLGKRIQSSKTDVETQIKNTKTALEEESVKLDNKLVEVLETQLKLKQEETKVKVQPTTSNEKADHSLALKVADEVIRIQKNLSRMDESTKGLKQLGSSVKRIQDNFASNGYELVEMLGKEYSEGMKATVNFVQDEDFEEGKRLITRIIKPQVNYKGTMIQTAQIEVTEA
jgi:phenylalanyl-tRNA synthetase alpha subunit